MDAPGTRSNPVMATLVKPRRKRVRVTTEVVQTRSMTTVVTARPELRRKQHNATERRRIVHMNEAMDRLRKACGLPEGTKKIEVLNRAFFLVEMNRTPDVFDVFVDGHVFDEALEG